MQFAPIDLHHLWNSSKKPSIYSLHHQPLLWRQGEPTRTGTSRYMGVRLHRPPPVQWRPRLHACQQPHRWVLDCRVSRDVRKGHSCCAIFAHRFVFFPSLCSVHPYPSANKQTRAVQISSLCTLPSPRRTGPKSTTRATPKAKGATGAFLAIPHCAILN